jgi:hypothetical protein
MINQIEEKIWCKREKVFYLSMMRELLGFHSRAATPELKMQFKQLINIWASIYRDIIKPLEKSLS